MFATPVANQIKINIGYTMPNGIHVLEIRYDPAAQSYQSFPDALQYAGVQYGKASFNSDSNTIVYRSDIATATAQ